MEDYAPAVQEILTQGGTIIWDKKGRQSLTRTRPTKRADRGFNAEAVRRAGIRLGCKDKEMLQFLKFGCYDCSKNTPQELWFAPHSATIYRNWVTFHKNFQDEILKY